MRKSSSWRILSLVVILAMALSSCAQATPAATAEPQQEPTQAVSAPTTAVNAPTEAPQSTEAPAAEKVTVTYMTGFSDVEVKNYIGSFEAAHPDITIKYINMTDRNQLLTSLAAGDGPDVFETDGPAMNMEYSDAGKLLDLTPFAEQFGWKDKILPWAYDASLVKGKLFSLPQTYESMVLYYNPKMFKDNNWAPPKTWEDVENLCTEAAKAKIWCLAHGGGDTLNDWYVSSYFSEYAGGSEFYKAMTGTAKFSDESFVDAVKLMKAEMDKGWWSGNLDNYSSFKWPDYKTSFCQGKAAMMISGTWDFNWVPVNCKEAGIDNPDWDWVPLPAMHSGVTANYPLAIGSCMAINAASKQPAAAAQFLDWLVNDSKRAAVRAKEFNFGEWVAPIKYSESDFTSDVDPRVVRYLVDFAKVTGEGNIGYATWTFFPVEAENFIVQELGAVFSGTMTPEAFGEGLQKTMDTARADGKVPSIPKPAGQ